MTGGWREAQFQRRRVQTTATLFVEKVGGDDGDDDDDSIAKVVFVLVSSSASSFLSMLPDAAVDPTRKHTTRSVGAEQNRNYTLYWKGDG